MVDPCGMCRKHLLGEHLEIHMLNGSLKRGRSITGFLVKKLLEPTAMHRRHTELATEMARRGYAHQSPLELLGSLRKFSKFKVDRAESLKELTSRCAMCASMTKENEAAKTAARKIYEGEKTRRYRKNHGKAVNSRNVAWLKTQREKAAGSKTPKRCSVCHKVDKIHFDHDRKSGAFRGWLCQHCNWILGHVNDSPKILYKLAEYLEDFAQVSLADKKILAARVSTRAWRGRTKK